MDKFPPIADEARLTRLASEGDKDAFGALYIYYYPRVYRSVFFICRSAEDTDEIIQDAFLKCWQSKESLLFVRSFKDYIYTISKNLLINHFRRSRTKARMEASITVASEEPDLPEDQLIFRQYQDVALKAINRLSAQKRKIFLLRTQEGMKLDEIAREMGLSRAAVKKHLYGAMASIKEELSMNADWKETALTILFMLNIGSSLPIRFSHH